MSAIRMLVPLYSVDDYLQWQGDWELWDGSPVSMTPSRFGRHQLIVGRVLMRIQTAIDASGCRCTVVSELDWIVDEATVVRPDIMIVCGDFPDQDHLRHTPNAVIEVLSKSTADRDRYGKRLLYEKAGVTNYFIVSI